MKNYWLFLMLLPLAIQAVPPETRPQIGLRENVPQTHALSGARIIPRPGEVIENGTVLVRDGLIEAVGENLEIPEDARVWDLEGMTIYPGFIDAYAVFGTTKQASESVHDAHWNDSVHPERLVLESLTLEAKDLESRRALGFTTAHLAPNAGLFRGQGALVQLSSPEDDGFVLNAQAAHHVAFSTSRDYPKSLMGCIALIRQTLSDAQWYRQYRQAYKKQPNMVRPGEKQALAALTHVVGRPRERVFFRLGDEADIDRAVAIADEFKLKRVLVDPGYGYRHPKPFKRGRNALVLSLAFPETPGVTDPDHALDISLEHLQHWEAAPANAAALQGQEISFSLSTYQLEDQLDKFWENVRRAVQHGLKEEAALEALTLEPARLLGESERLGEIATGRIANLTVTAGNPFLDKKAKIRQVWIDGHPWLDKQERPRGGPQGSWEAAWTGVDGPARFEISGSAKKPKLKITEPEPDKPIETDVDMAGGLTLGFTLPAKVFGTEDGKVRLKAYLNPKTLVGQGVLPDGRRFSWSARRGEPAEESAESENMEPIHVDPFEQYPAGAYPGTVKEAKKLPKRIFIKNATVWTCGAQGVLENANLVVEDGRIIALGSGVEPEKGAHIIDAKGKHVTPGLIDCHSHTAISRGVNEGSHAVTCEVRIGDVIDPTDISIYRQLAGGLTTANLLHGSANPMGGQNQVIKLRWGKKAGGMKFKGAKPGVKFALGENVKQSNWGSGSTTRYPQTRMGVEQLMRDTFLAAKEYGEAKQRHTEQERALPFRTNLRLEAVLEILRGERLVHIHSYRQDEILMFVRLAQEFGFTVGTFQHVLEGYKVPHELLEIQAGASSFSDWWAYKFEVYDAIPHNGALLHRAGVLTSFNSDDRELATRLNTEAAKAVKYGGVTPEEALKFVTLNPAKQLRIDHRVGSLEVGKDADFVIWSGPPLSTLSRCEQTWIEGVPYFDLETDAEHERQATAERQRLIAKIMEDPEKKDSEKDKEEEESEDTLTLDDRLRLLSPWGQYEMIDYQGLYHDGQALHACTGCYCDFR